MLSELYDTVVTYCLYLVCILLGNGLGVHRQVDLIGLARLYLGPAVKQAYLEARSKYQASYTRHIQPRLGNALFVGKQ